MPVTVARDTAIVFAREFVPALREPVSLLISMGQPLLFLFLFGSLLPGVTDVAGGSSSWQWFVPGSLVMMCLIGPMSAGHTLLGELTGGSLERMLVTPLNRAAMIIGRTLKEAVVLLAQAILIIALALPLGLQLHTISMLIGLVVLVVFAIGLGALSFVLAIASQPSGELFWIVTQVLMFPLVLLSGVLLPTDTGPAWLRTIASLNPVSYIVEAQRALFTGHIATLPVLAGTLAAGVIATVGLALATRALRHAT